MANTYKWTINALDAKISNEDGNENVVYTVHWGYSATDESGDHVTSSIGTHGVEYDAANFTAYADLTEEQVIGWLEAGLNVESMKASLDSQIELLKTPVDTTFHAPFAVVPEVPSEEVVEE
jgi:S-methylmethionine-dependent homocysteine/selenocysteine methylase